MVNTTNMGPVNRETKELSLIIARKQPGFISFKRDPVKSFLIPLFSIAIFNSKTAPKMAKFINRNFLHSSRFNHLIEKIFCKVHSPSSPTSSEKLSRVGRRVMESTQKRWTAAKNLGDEGVSKKITANASILGVTLGTALAYVFCTNSKAHKHEVVTAIEKKIEGLSDKTEKILTSPLTAINLHRENIEARVRKIRQLISTLPEDLQAQFNEKLDAQLALAKENSEEIETFIRQDVNRLVLRERQIDIAVEIETGEKKVVLCNCAEPLIYIGLLLLARTAPVAALLDRIFAHAKTHLTIGSAEVLEKISSALTLTFLSNGINFLLDQKMAPSEVNVLVKKAFSNLGLPDELIPKIEEPGAIGKIATKTSGKFIEKALALAANSLLRTNTVIGAASGALLGYGTERVASASQIAVDMVENEEVGRLLDKAEEVFLEQSVIRITKIASKISDFQNKETAALDDIEKEALEALKENLPDQLDSEFLPPPPATTKKVEQAAPSISKLKFEGFYPFKFFARRLSPMGGLM